MKVLRSSLVLSCLLLTVAALAAAPPVAKRELKVLEMHGDRREDHYYWLREKTNPEVIRHLEAENRYTDAVMKPTEALQKRLYDEMLSRIVQADSTVPYRYGGYWYYTRWEEGKQYPIHCRRKDTPGAAEEIILDANQLAVGHAFFQVRNLDVSDDGNLLVYTVDTTGFRQYVLQVKDLRTGKLLPDTAQRVTSVTWAADNRTLFLTVEDPQTKRSNQLLRLALGDKEPTLLFEEKDERFAMGVGRTRSGAYILASSSSETTSETRYVPADKPLAEWTTILPRREGHKYGVDHRGDEFFLTTNDRGINYRLVRTPVTAPQPENWREVVPHRPEVMLEGVSLFFRHAVLEEREGGLEQLTVLDLETGTSNRVGFPEPVYSISYATNAEFDTTVFNYSYQSLVTPGSTYQLDMRTRQSTLVKQTKVPNYEKSNYVSERLFAKASDGTLVPVSVVYRKGLVRDGKAPLLLEGYGAYGISNDVDFSSTRLSLLDRGFVYAVAHIRGGGEMGKRWHEQGMLLNKRNTFTDFIASAEHLIAEKYTSKEKLAIEGASAGGLLMGAVTNMRPDLFRVVLTGVPFVDVLTTMLDPTIPLTTEEYDEWGNPNDPKFYAYMKTYDPYENLTAKAYPTMLVKTGLNDSQVMYWEPAKYVAKLRHLKTDSNPLLFKINMTAGHGGASGRFEALRERAFDFAFLTTQLGVESPSTATR